MSNLHLYEIANQYQQLKALEDMTDLPAEVIHDTLQALEGELQVKAVNIAKFIENLEASAEAIQAAANAMTQRAKRVQNRADSIKAYLLFQMQACEISKVECPEFTISVRNNPDAVVISEGATLPEEFMTQPETPAPVPDKKALKEALKSGREVPGAWLASGQHLRITT